MIKICPECININVDTEICKTCGFPLSKKVIGRMDDYYFYDSLELINMGQLESAKKKLIEKKSSINDNKLDVLLDKISLIEDMMQRSDDHCKRAMYSFQNGDYKNALTEIKAAQGIYSNPRFNEIENQIKNATLKSESLEMAREKYEEGLLLKKSGDTIKALELLKLAQELDTSNPVYKNTYKAECEEYLQAEINKINSSLSSGDFQLAEILLNSLMPLGNHDSRISMLQSQIMEGRRKKKSKKSTTITMVVIIAIITAGSGIFWLVKQQNAKNKWNSALKEGSIPTLQDYINENPESNYITEATGKLQQLLTTDSLEWSKVETKITRTTAENYIAFLSDIKGLHLADAQNILDSLDWNQIAKSDDLEVFQDYINKHPDSKFLDLARGKLAQGVPEDERVFILNYISNYYQLYEARDLETVMTYYDPITPIFASKKNITKAELRVLFENDLKSVSKASSKIDPVSFKVKKDQDDNYLIIFNSDSYITRIDPDQPTDSFDNQTPVENNYYTNTTWDLTLTPDKKIKSYRYKIISEQKINQ